MPYSEAALFELALSQPRSEFVRRLPTWFLIVPATEAPRPAAAFQTCEGRAVALTGEDAAEANRTPRWARLPWVASPIVKGPSRAFADRVSVGRTPNVDLVIRSPLVSKLHAHFLPAGGELSVVDQGSRNGTFVNGARLQPKNVAPVASGDLVSFAGVQCEVVSADVLYYALRRRHFAMEEAARRASQSPPVPVLFDAAPEWCDETWQVGERDPRKNR
jgi:hypothetical protein